MEAVLVVAAAVMAVHLVDTRVGVAIVVGWLAVWKEADPVGRRVGFVAES